MTHANRKRVFVLEFRKMHKLITSFGDDSISLFLQDFVINIERLPVDEVYSNGCFVIENEKGIPEVRTNMFKTLPNCFRIPQNLRDGIYGFQIVFRSPYGEGEPYGFFRLQKGIPFRKLGRHVEFIPSPILDCNKSFLSKQKEDLHNGLLCHGQKPSAVIQSADPEIARLSVELTKNSPDTVGKIKDIYFFVHRTLSYDQDALKNGSYVDTGQTAKEALKFGRCVCQGFANLTVAMCRAIGIPSYSIGAYAKPIDKQWGEFREEDYPEGKHQIAMAWANCLDRWVIMDPTWDSDQEYDENGYGKRHGDGFPYKFFDMTTEFLSYTHRLDEVLKI